VFTILTKPNLLFHLNSFTQFMIRKLDKHLVKIWFTLVRIIKLCWSYRNCSSSYVQQSFTTPVTNIASKPETKFNGVNRTYYSTDITYRFRTIFKRNHISNGYSQGSISLSSPIPKFDDRCARKNRYGPSPEFPLAYTFFNDWILRSACFLLVTR